MLFAVGKGVTNKKIEKMRMNPGLELEVSMSTQFSMEI